MAVQDEASFKRYAANGVATEFGIPFLLLAAQDLQVTLDGVPVVSGFTVTGLGSNIGQIIFAVAPTGDLLLQRVVPFERLTDYQDNGDLLARTVNRDFDRLWLANQELRRDDGRALVVSPLEPEGIPPLPVRALRQLRMLAFDVGGNPIPSNLTLEQLEQQPNLAAAAVAAAQASALESASHANQAATSASEAEDSADDAAGAAAAAATSVTEADAIAQSLSGAAVPMLSVIFWPKRSTIPAGYVAADGQLLSRSTYPDAAAAVVSGMAPVVTDANWLANLHLRGAYSSGDGSTTFRMPDYNGKSAGSWGAAFLRGDGAGSAANSGWLQRDAMQGHFHRGESGSATGLNWGATTAGGGATFNVTAAIREPISDGVNGTPRTASETRPVNVTGVWIVKLFGAVTNAGSADAAQLASDFANLASRTTVAEGKVAALEAGIKQAPELLWSGSAGSAGNVLALSRPLAAGDIVWLIHADGLSVQSHVNVATVEKMVSGSAWQWSFGAGGYTQLTYNNASQFTVAALTGGYPVGKVYASRAKN